MHQNTKNHVDVKETKIKLIKYASGIFDIEIALIKMFKENCLRYKQLQALEIAILD